jgi:hypothetical protein
MELQQTLRKLCSIQEPRATVATLALNLAKARLPDSMTGPSHQSRVLDWLGSIDHSKPVREVLREVSGKLALYLETELRPETEALFLVAGPGIWQPFALGVPIKDFLYVGRTPYLAPLLEALTRLSRAYVLRFDRREAILEEVSMGAKREVERFRSHDVERDAEHQMSGHTTHHSGSGRTATRMGGGGRDRFQHRVEDSVAAMLHKAADKVLGFQKEAPSEAIYAFGDRKHFPYFRDRLPPSLRSQAIHVGPVPHRQEEAIGRSVREQQDLRVRHRIGEEIREFQARRAERCHVASGPEDILALLATGKVSRVLLDPTDPLQGTKCVLCGRRAGMEKEQCDDCGNALALTSMTQEVVSYAQRHPPVPLTFVPPGEPWLEESGGMAALLSEKGSPLRAGSLPPAVARTAGALHR